ncbi:MAG: cupin domain-containing protein [Alphaproteobacteria bacterium]|nr:cupin domain-containing protein [Alphaproteobacteria bacterium]
MIRDIIANNQTHMLVGNLTMGTTFKVLNWKHELAHAIPDKAVGISLASLAGNELFTSYVTEISPQSFVAAHYHPEGIEIYQILSGQGMMKTGVVVPDNTIKWNHPTEVQSGDFFTIHPGIVHRLENNSLEKLILIVTCSPSNLVHNRVVVEKGYCGI